MRVFRMTIAITMVLFVALPMVLIAGGGRESPAPDVTTVRLGLWGAEAAINAYTENSRGIEEVYPGVRIDMQPSPSSQEFWNTLPGRIAAGTAPDILQLTNEGAFEYIEAGLFIPIGEILEAEGLSMDAFSESALDIWSVDGELYGIPVSVGPAMFFINVDMWNEAGLGEYPTTWEEVEQAARALTTSNRHGLIINIHPFHLTNYVLSHGGGWGYGRTIASEANERGLNRVIRMFEEGIAVSPQQAGYGWDGEVFSNRAAAMSTGGHWYKAFLSNAAPDLNWVAIPMPQGGAIASTSHSEAIVVLRDAVDRSAAVKAAYYLAREQALENLMIKASINPARPSLSAQYYEVNPEFQAVQPYVQYGQDFGYPAETSRFIDALVRAMEERILAGSGKPTREILADLQRSFR